ncbi:MAG: adenosylmethionine decarboxylase [Alphaproteobacteria bacterium]
MTQTVAASRITAVPASARTRHEALESWAEGRIKPAARERPASAGTRAESDDSIERSNRRYAGTHLLIDLWGARRLDDLALAEATLREAVDAVGATLLHVHLHHFRPNGGVSGVAVLAESHISVHTWPETGYAALDIFVCGDCDPHAAIPVLRRAWTPDRVQISEHKRGLAE